MNYAVYAIVCFTLLQQMNLTDAIAVCLQHKDEVHLLESFLGIERENFRTFFDQKSAEMLALEKISPL